MLVLTANTVEELKDLITKNPSMVVKFEAEWCPPCKVLTPILKKVMEEKYINIPLVAVDVDNVDAVAWDIRGIPTTLVFKEGVEVLRLVGAAPESTLATKLATVL